MPTPDTCCTCATLLTDTEPPYDPSSEKPLLVDRRLDCCFRVICARCQFQNARFQTYCPFCQISTAPSALPPHGLRLPPAYSKTEGESSLRHVLSQNPPEATETAPPSYESITQQSPTSISKNTTTNETPTTEAVDAAAATNVDDIIHHLSPRDTLPSLSLAYSVPLPLLRHHNNLYSDALLPARKHLLIPASHYRGPPLSTPPDPAEEERKNKLRRWMVATKCAEYDVGVLYLRGAAWDLEAAVRVWREDEKWERRNPNLWDKRKGKERRRRSVLVGGSGGLVGQLS